MIKRILAVVISEPTFIVPIFFIAVAFIQSWGVAGFLPLSFANLVRYYWALFFLCFFFALTITVWPVAHPFINSLRRVGLVRAYVIVWTPAALAIATIVWLRDAILAIDFGTNYFLMALSVIPIALSITILVSHLKYLTLPIRFGVPEFTGDPKSVLLTEGIYARIRHPRYVEVILWSIGYALFTNYLAVYLALFLLLPFIHTIVLLEEKELKARFGRVYEEYCRRVPRYVPKVFWGNQKAA